MSFTSSIVDSLVMSVAPSIAVNNPMRSDFEMVFKLANLLHLLPGDADDDETMEIDEVSDSSPPFYL